MIRSRKTLRGTLIIGGFIFGYMKFLICGMLVRHNGLTNIIRFGSFALILYILQVFRFSLYDCPCPRKFSEPNAGPQTT